MKYSIAHRYSLFLAVITAIVGCCVLLVNLYYLERYASESLDSGQKQLSSIVEKKIIQDAELMANTLASNLDMAVYHDDFSAIEEQLEVLNNENHVLYTYIHNTEGTILHDGTEKLLSYGHPITQHLPLETDQITSLQTEKRAQFIHLAAPIQVGDNTLAILRIGIANEDAERDIRNISSDLERQATRLRDDIIVTSLSFISLLLLIATVLVFIFSQRLLAPIKLMAERCNRYANGENETSFNLKRNDEFGVLGDALDHMRVSVAESQKQISELAYLDPLTHLPNRRMFNEELDSLINWAKQHEDHIAVLFIDLDHFKRVNDVAGHATGDLLLQQVAERLSEILHSVSERVDMPVPENLLLSRLGGDEFVMMIPSYKDNYVLTEIAEKIEQILDEPFTIKGNSYTISASVGITKYPEHADNLTDLIKQADIAMYAAKQSGRKRHRFFEAAMNHEIIHKIKTIEGVREALDQEQFYLAYQPIVDLKSGALIGAEALIRWESPERGNVPPVSFIPLIETTDLIIPLTLWVLRKACEDLSKHILPRDPSFKLSVNISGAAMKESSLCKKIDDILQQYQLPPHRLHLEITETSMVENIEQCSNTLNQWKNSGADIWIDDFGTGYSSLGYLHALPLDGLKIDRTFVSNPSNKHQVIETIVALANALNLETIAEGIETDEQNSYMLTMGSDYGQGYLFSRPVVIDSLLNQMDCAIDYES